MIGIYPGSFDPFTNGHLEIVEQAADIFDELIILVANNPEKRHWFEAGERKRIIEAAIPYSG